MNIYRNWFLACRPWSFSMSAISVSVGGALASLDGPFSWGFFLITLLGIVLIHAATNLMNDCYDVRSGVDKLDTSTAQYRPHPLMEGHLKLSQVHKGALLIYFGATLICLFLTLTRGWTILVLGVLGVLASMTYTAPPLKYKYHALGELSVFLMWGPLIVEGTYFVQRQAFSQAALWVSLPFGALVALVLLANNLRDMNHDQREGIATLPIVLGKEKGILLYLTLVFLAYLAVVIMSLFGPLTAWSLIVLLSLPTAFKLMKALTKKLPIDADARTAQLDTVFGGLLVISLILERLI